MKQEQIEKMIQSLEHTHRGKTSPKVLAAELSITEALAQELLAEFREKHKITPKPRTRRPKVVKSPRARTSTTKRAPARRKGSAMEQLAPKILPWVALIVAAICLGRSILFTYNYYSRTGGQLEALTMAIVFSGVVLVAPSIFILGLANRRIWISIFSFLLSGLFMFMNVNITINEQAYTRTHQEGVVASEETLESVSRAKAQVAQKKEAIELSKEAVKLYNTEIATLLEQSEQAKADQLRAESEVQKAYYQREFNRLRDNKAAALENRNAEQAKIEALTKEIQELQGTPGYFSETLRKELDTNAGVIDTVWGVALEVAGPILTALALFL